MKRILVNAISIKMGGGAVVLEKLMRGLCLEQPDTHWLLILDDAICFSCDLPNVTKFTFSWIKKTPAHFWFWNMIYLPKFAQRVKAKLLFSQTNFLPLKALPCPSLLLVHHAGYFSKQYAEKYFQIYTRRRDRLEWKARGYWVKNSMKRATKVTVQTKALHDAIDEKSKGMGKKITVIPHGPGVANGSVTHKTYPEQRIWRIGYLIKYGVQKNFDVLFAAVKAIHQQGIRCCLVLTLDLKDKDYKHIEPLLNQYALQNVIENHGEIDHAEMRALYQTLDLFVYPSFCESFGFSLVEAMYYGLPILASETPSNREVLGEKGLFFQVNCKNDLVKKLLTVIQDSADYDAVVRHSVQQREMYDWSRTVKQLSCLMNSLEVI